MNVKQKIQLYLNREYAKTLPENQKKRKSDVSQVAGKMLILFFAALLVFTIVSRAAASITVAQVTVTKPQRSKLDYMVNGTGTIESADETYLNVISGYRIDKVNVSLGQKVEQGETLFQYSLDDLQNKYDSQKIEVEKLKLQIQQAELNRTSSSSPSRDTSALSLKQAKDNLKTVELDLKEAEKDYEDSANKTKEKLLKDMEKEYLEVQKNYTSAVSKQERELAISLRTVVDAKAGLSQANTIINNTIEMIDTYEAAVLSKNSLFIYNAKEALYKAFYNSSANYSEHKADILAAELTVSRAWEDLSAKEEERLTILTKYNNAISNAFLALENAKNSSDSAINSEGNIKLLTVQYDAANNNYLEKQSEYKTEIKHLKRNIEDANYALNRIKSKDNTLEGYLNAYQMAIIGTGDLSTAWENLYHFLIGDDLNEIEKEVEAKSLALTRVEEDYETIRVEQEKNLSDLQTKMVTLEDTINSMKDGTYDYEEALEVKKQAVITAKEAVRRAKQSVDSAEVQYQLEEQISADVAASNQKNVKNTDLTVQGYHLDLSVKEEELASLQELLNCSGKQESPSSGTITTMDLEVGKTTTDGQLIKIGRGDYRFKAEIDKEGAKHVNVGDEISITLEGKENAIETIVKAISINVSGKAELTAIMSEGDYLFGESASFVISEQSDTFDMCVPMQAIRMDNGKYYVLITNEQESILGKELIAYRVNLKILSKDSATAAVDYELSSNDYVIIESSKNIEDGDKVRLKNN